MEVSQSVDGELGWGLNVFGGVCESIKGQGFVFSVWKFKWMKFIWN